MTSIIGKKIPRVDARQKVAGTAKYTDDISYPGMWYGAVVHAMIPRGRIKSVKFNPSFDWSKVIVADYRDIPGKNIVVQIKDDQPFLVEYYSSSEGALATESRSTNSSRLAPPHGGASSNINHAGEAVCLIAGPTKELAEEARRNVIVEYEELPAVFNIFESRSKKTLIYGDNNEICRYNVNKGDVARAFAEADHVIEGEYKTSYHEHAYLEPQGIIAIPRQDGGFTIEGSLQCPYYVLKAITAFLNLPAEKVNIRQAVMGGAFGGKEDYPSLLAGYAVLLAKKSGHPVKIIYDRNEDILFTTKRHPSIVRHKTGVMKDGTITAMDIDVAFDGGAYATLSPVVLARGLLHSWGPYRCPNVSASAVCYATNNVPTGAFRGFGAPQTLFAVESHMDVIADKLGISPLELRRKNCFKLGDETATGQKLKESVGALECLERAVKSAQFEKKWNNGKSSVVSYQSSAPTTDDRRPTARKGIGISLFMHGAAFTGSGEAIMKGRTGLRLEKDGSLTILTGCTDMGQGAHSVLPQIVAEAMGIPISKVRCAVPDTAYCPDSGPTVASRTTMVIGKVLMWCCEELRRRIDNWSRRLQPAIRNDKRRLKSATPIAKFARQFGPLTIEKHYEQPPGINWNQDKFVGDAYPAYAWGCNVAEVEVDTETFEIKVDKIYMAYDVGRAINPQLVEGQLEGGTLQALGYAILEDMKYEKGVPKNNRFQTYIIPTAKDAPEFETIIVEDKFSWGPYGAKGLGELPFDGGAPAIANAVYNAIGVRVKDLPITAERIMQITQMTNPK